jgi:hypothetical protein
MSAAIRKLIASLSSKLVDEDDKTKRRSIAASIEAAKKTLKHIEHTETEESPDEEDEEEEEEAAGNETDRTEAEEPPPDDDGDDDGDEEDDEEDEAEEAKALAALAAGVPGKKGQRLAGALQALIDKAQANDASAKRIAAIERERRSEKREALIMGALRAEGGPRITPAQAKWLRGQKLATVQSYLAAHTKPIVRTEELRVESDGRPDAQGLSAAIRKSIAQAVAAGADEAKLIKAHQDELAKAGGKTGTH